MTPHDWNRTAQELDTSGWARLPGLLDAATCATTAALYEQDALFRSRVRMARHGFGRGEYRYFTDPLPDPVGALRLALYPPLAAIANRWQERLGLPGRYPDNHPEYLQRCQAAGQTRPTPLLLRYDAGDYNCLHQDLYGEEVFPLQVVVLLSRPNEDFEGGELVLTEQRPRMQSRVEVLQLGQGDGAIIAVNNRPVQGAQGSYRVRMRHGVSTLRRGRRHALGIIFHDAA